MPDRDCTQSGHHWHEVDGTIFNRKRELRKNDVIDVHCCWCAEQTTKMGYGERNPTAPSMVECGPNV